MKFLQREAIRDDKKRGILNDVEMKRFRKSLPPQQSVYVQYISYQLMSEAKLRQKIGPSLFENKLNILCCASVKISRGEPYFKGAFANSGGHTKCIHFSPVKSRHNFGKFLFLIFN